MDKWVGKTAIVTGASAGIGAALFKDMANAGINVVGFARRKEKVEELIAENKKATGKMYAVQCDVTSESSIQEAFEWVSKKLGGCDILVNNAGCAKYSSILDDGNTDMLRAVIETNIFGLLLCTKEAFKQMKVRDNYGFIININSIVGHKVPFFIGMKPSSNIYSGTKHAVTAATEVLRQELIFMKNEKIRVSSVSPGLVATEFREAGGFTNTTYANMTALNAEDVSDAVMYLLKTKPHVNITELTIKPVGELA